MISSSIEQKLLVMAQNLYNVLGNKIWNLIPDELKSGNNLTIFKANIKKWIPRDCPCRLCKNYVIGVGFVHIS